MLFEPGEAAKRFVVCVDDRLRPLPQRLRAWFAQQDFAVGKNDLDRVKVTEIGGLEPVFDGRRQIISFDDEMFGHMRTQS